MPVRPAEAGHAPAERQNDTGPVRKLRLGGGASRVPVQNKPATESPFRTLVNAIGQSLGSKTPSAKTFSGRKTSSATPSAAKTSTPTPSAGRQGMPQTPAAKSTSAGQSRLPSTPAPSRIPSTPISSRIPSKSSASKIPSTPNPSKVPSTPTLSRVYSTPASAYRHPFTPASSRVENADAKTPARRSSLSSSASSSASISSSGLARKQNGSSNQRSTATSSGRVLEPKTPVSKSTSIPPKTPKAETNPTTPSSNVSAVLTPASRRPVVSSTTPGHKPTSVRTRSKSFLPTTPVSKQSSAPPTTPVNGDTGFSTPHGNGGGPLLTFYTPKSTLPLTPLQPRNFNVPESSRRLHFGIDVEAMAEQENLGTKSPKSSGTEMTFAFDRSRLAQIKARRKSESEVLKSPAQRIRVPASQTVAKSLLQTPGTRGLQQVDEDRSARFDEEPLAPSWVQTPGKRRVANSLF